MVIETPTVGIVGTVIKTPTDIVRNGAVIIDSQRGTIVSVGDEAILREYGPEAVYGNKRYIVMPGLVNTHSHVAMTLFRGFPGTVSGFKWLRGIWELERALRPRHVYAGALLGLAHAIKSGVTTIADHYYFAEETAKAALKLNARVVLARTFMDLVEGPPGHGDLESSLRFAIEFKDHSDLIRTMLGPHSLYTCSWDSLIKTAEESLDKNIRVHIHLSESRDELDYIRSKYKTTSIRLANSLRLLDNFPLIAHATYVSDDEIEMLTRKPVGIAYAPFTKMRGGQDISPIVELQKRGAKIGLATDGPTSVYSLDMFREMRMLLSAQNYKKGSPDAMKPEEALYIATLGGARALGLEDKIGSIEPGKLADIIVLSPDSLKIHPFTNPIQAAVYTFNPEDVKYVFINGELVVDRGKLTKVNEEDIIKEFDRALHELKSEVSTHA